MEANTKNEMIEVIPAELTYYSSKIEITTEGSTYKYKDKKNELDELVTIQFSKFDLQGIGRIFAECKQLKEENTK